VGESTNRLVCSQCRAPSAVGDLKCARCGRAWLDEDCVAQARRLTTELVQSLRADPYLRSATLLSYTLRSHVRGFLDDPSHPLAKALLHHLHALACLAGAAAPRQLLPHAELHWVQPHAPVLARALRYVRERHREAIEAVARDLPGARVFDDWYREWIEQAG
jgi:hypothetical protein